MDREVLTKAAPDEVAAPFDPVVGLTPEQWVAVEAEAIRVNERYLIELVEGHAFCPFAKEGRKRGEVHRYVHRFERADVEPLVRLMHRVARDPTHVVTQVIVPLIEVAPGPWSRFGRELTALGHARLGGPEVLAIAPLHPALPYSTASAGALVPLFRRAPDPTLQWVRLDGLAAVYEGRGHGTGFVDTSDPSRVAALLAEASEPKRPLWDRIAETNALTVQRLGADVVEGLHRALHEDAQSAYRRVLET